MCLFTCWIRRWWKFVNGKDRKKEERKGGCCGEREREREGASEREIL